MNDEDDYGPSEEYQARNDAVVYAAARFVRRHPVGTVVFFVIFVLVIIAENIGK